MAKAVWIRWRFARANGLQSALAAASFAVGTVGFGATSVEAERVVGDGKAFGFSNRMLAFFDLGVVKLFHLAAV